MVRPMAKAAAMAKREIHIRPCPPFFEGHCYPPRLRLRILMFHSYLGRIKGSMKCLKKPDVTWLFVVPGTANGVSARLTLARTFLGIFRNACEICRLRQLPRQAKPLGS